jgi:serine/threonine-protein kinase RsbW
MEETRTTTPDAEIRIERLAVADAGVLPEAIRVAYGDSYDHAWAYDAAAVASRLADGSLVSFVGRAHGGPDDGRVVGHAGLMRDAPTAPVGESGLAVVDPAWRSHHLFPTLKRHLAEWCTAEGMLGMYSDVTAAHPYSETANLHLGARETGFLLGYIPADVTYTDLDAVAGRRLTVALFWLATNPLPRRTVHVPSWHRPVLRLLYDHVALPRDFADDTPSLPTVETALRTVEDEDHDEAFITVDVAGWDLLDALGAEQQRLTDKGRKAIYLDFSLADPATAALPPEVHDDLGFFFGGIVPELRDGDVLRLQHLHEADADPSDVTTASDFGAELLDYIFSRKRTAAHAGTS